jgi:adenylate cyclase
MAKKPEKTKSSSQKKAKSKGKVIFPLGAKFSFFVGLLLVGIMVVIMMFIYTWAGTALEKEVKERGIAIAKNIANNAADPLIKNDDLPLAYLTKEAVQYPMKTEVAEGSLLDGLIGVIKNDILNTKEDLSIKNEGIYEAVIVKNGLIASANDVLRNGNTYTLPAGIRPLKGSDDVLVQDYFRDAHHYFDIAVPVATTINGVKYTVGEVHLTISRSIISKVVTVAAVQIGLIILAALLFGIIVSIMLVNFMVKPIGYLMEGVRAIGEGNYDVEIKVRTNDELGLLTTTFNDTAKSLKEKELLKGAFSTYVSSEIMHEVLKDPKKLALGGKRVRATMLFTDIRGFTSMSETLEPEQVVAVINEYLTVQTDKVLKWKGVLDKFVGDCVMAVYGVPMAKEDDTYRAVRTAMDIRESVEKLNKIRERAKQITVGIGIGVNTGEVVSGNMGSPQKMDYTVIGDNVNLASRLEANAPAGKIYVSESTYNETKDRIEYVELEAIKVKGKKEPVRVFDPISVKPGVDDKK